MANFEYKNIDEVLSTNLPVRGIRVNLEDNRLLDKKPVEPSIDPPPTPTDPFEFHTFLPNGAYVSSLYDLQSWKVDGTAVSLDVHRDMRATRNLPGVYKVVYNFLKNWIGGYNSPVKLFISDVSTDRTELKLSLVNPDSQDGVEQIKNFVLSYLRPTPSFPTIVLNFGENKIVSVINVAPNVNFNGSINSFFVKLYEPLPADLDIFFQCWVAEELMKPYIDTVNYLMEERVIEPNRLKGPNFEVDRDYWISTETDYKSWNEILSVNVQTSQEIVDRYISSSNLPVQLNIDFREFENFIFYSSAEDRLNNFVYKMELIERYNNELLLLENVYTGSLVSNKVKIKGLRDKTISGFDGFEKWLYYETTSSNYYTYQSSSTVTPYPKYLVTGNDYNIATKEGKYKFYTSGSSQVQSWYDNLIISASNYDLKNYNSLNKAIPEYLRDDSENDQFTTFVNMVGQHFDIMYLYTDHILKKNLREENPKSGMSQDLIYEATKNLGWTLSHGTQAKDLWEYALGVSGSGEPIWTGKTTVNKYFSKTEEERTKEVWRRILNNLPYIYKSKGTSRGIKAILSAYGIPQTLLTIREYGGPDNADLGVIPRAEWEKHTYFLNFSGSYPLPTHQQHVSVPWDRVNNADGNWQYPDTLTFRWKMEPNRLYQYTSDPVQTLLQKQSGSRVDWFVTMNKNGTDVEKGSIYFYIGDGTTYATASITDQYFYDDVPLNLMLRRRLTSDLTSSNQIYDFFVKTNKYGKIAIEKSASIVVSGSLTGSYNRAWSSDGILYIGSGSNQQTDKILSGSIYELRYWSNPLLESSFDNHVLSARSYNGNYETSSFYDLHAQFKFWQKFDVATTTSISSSHPDQSKTRFYNSPKLVNFYGFDSGAFESIVETYNMEVATLGNNTIYTEKVRIDSGSLIAGLSTDRSAEVSAFDNYSVDSNKLMVAFSPQNVINEDIYESIGGVELDDYIGDYSNISKGYYPNLKWLAREYWQKYPNKNDFNAYIDLISVFDFSVFEQIRQTLPARANPILGIVVEPNILERSKVGNIGRNISGEPNNVFRTNEISSSVLAKMEYISKATSVQMIGFDIAEGDVADDIQGEYDIPNKTIKISEPDQKTGFVSSSISAINTSYNNRETSIRTEIPSAILSYEKKEGSAQIEDPKTVTQYNSKRTIIPVKDPEPVLSYDNKNASVKTENPIPNISYNTKEKTLSVDSPNYVLVYNNKQTKIDVKEPSTISENVSKKTTIDANKPDTKINYNNKNGTVDVNLPGTVINYNNKDTFIPIDSGEPNLTYNTKNTLIDEKTIPSTDSTYNSSKTSIEVKNVNTFLEYKNLVGEEKIETAKPVLSYNTFQETITVEPNKPNLTYNQINSVITETKDIILNSVVNTISFNISNRNTSDFHRVVSSYNTVENYGLIPISTDSTYLRDNLVKTSDNVDYGYGLGWKTLPNADSKAIALMEFIETPTQDNFYSSYYLYYSSSRDIVAGKFYSSSFVDSKTRNQENIAIGLQNHRFVGSKLVGPDVNVNTRNTPDNKPVVEIHNVGSTQIIYNTYFDRGNLIVK